jgi:ketosteroid isomerase-like protein
MASFMIKAARLAATLACLAALGLAGCDSRPRTHHVITAKVIDTIKAGEVRWNEDNKSGDPNKILRHYAANAEIYLPGVPPVVGAPALRSFVTKTLEDPHFRLSFASDHVQAPRSGEVAVAKGDYTLTATDQESKQVQTTSGTYIAVYRPAGDDRWLVTWLMSTPSAAPQAAPDKP